ncbi:LysR family transcriptional regulator [Cucumibacter marinus]|uniref:LysR family transcriptional regulator n=1 Tax=Cucumibacter marinus TaxID=1121252 RepID=UPI0003FE5C22|nr:LysR family transcriptional regulator [Cucumibacter marinus]
MNELDLLRPTLAFATVVDTGSFRAAADRLGRSPPYVSQMVSDLEDRLGRQLLFRSTRRLSLTADGEAFLPHARAMANAFNQGLDTVRDTRRNLAGRLRVSAPSVLASPVFARIVSGFAAQYPGIELEIDLEDRVVDPVAARVDLALRIGDPGDDHRLARKLFTTRGVVCCGADLARDLTAPDDLMASTWLRSPATPPRLGLIGPGGRQFTADPKAQIVVNNAALIRTMLAEGTGYAVLPEFAIHEALDAGALTVAVPEWCIPDVAVHALYTERRTALTNARAFVDHVQAALSAL